MFNSKREQYNKLCSLLLFLMNIIFLKSIKKEGFYYLCNLPFFFIKPEIYYFIILSISSNSGPIFKL